MGGQGRNHHHSRTHHAEPVSRGIPHDQVHAPSRHRSHERGTLRGTINRKLRSKKLDNPINPVIKYFLFFVNVIILLLGSAILAIGAYVLYIKEKQIGSVLEFLFDPSVMLTLVGAVAVFVALIGVIGPLREVPIVIVAYYWLVTIFLVLEILVIILIFLFYFVPDARVALKLYPEESLNDAIVKYRDDADMEDFINTVQGMFDCCGISNDNEGYKAWGQNAYFNCSKGNPSREACAVPFSCCIINEGEAINLLCGADSLSPSPANPIEGRINTKGCLKGVEVFLQEHALAIGGGVIGFLIPQIFFVCLACALADQINEVRQGWTYQRSAPR